MEYFEYFEGSAKSITIFYVNKIPCALVIVILQDTNGNTICHIMVVYDNMKMFDLAVECGAAINILNNQQLTPLSTASFLARTEMFFHIANLEREVYWQIGTFCVTFRFIILYTS